MTNRRRRAVFLDRDGVLNRAIVRNGKPYPPSSVEELELLPDVREATCTLVEAGYLLICVTNQPDVARGAQRRELVEAINAALKAALPLEEIIVCYETEDDSPRRKPNPGMLLEAAQRHDIDLSRSYMVGDRWKDVEAGRRAGCRTILIDHGYREAWPVGPPEHRTASLAEATACILGYGRTQEEREVDMKSVSELRVKIFADGADKTSMLELYQKPYIKGFTTNPTLMRKAGVTDYVAFARDILQVIRDRPISFEVFSDDFEQMKSQARLIAGWGDNVYVKVPVTNTAGRSSAPLIRDLARDGVKLNVTALLALDQVRDVAAALSKETPAYISVFAGRIADTGRNPTPLMAAAVELLRMYPNVELIWASPRQLLNIYDADLIGCHIITVTPDILRKLHLVGKDLHDFSLDTVRMFRNDALRAGFEI